MKRNLTNMLLGVLAVEGAYLAWRFRGIKFKPQAPPIWRAPDKGKLYLPLPEASQCTSITELLDYLACGLHTLLLADDQRYTPPTREPYEGEKPQPDKGQGSGPYER
jgi:hypothetical protein